MNRYCSTRSFASSEKNARLVCARAAMGVGRCTIARSRLTGDGTNDDDAMRSRDALSRALRNSRVVNRKPAVAFNAPSDEGRCGGEE